ncbi:MAG TPA: hypothetical protein VFP47_09370, partial [Pyrinomonadaceae bacterium]|nr:hypothetical protein [Pyrinomonadaceae bacterium]
AIWSMSLVAHAQQSQAPQVKPVPRTEETSKSISPTPVRPVEEKLEPGVVIARVVSTSDPTKSYALYLPTSYNSAAASSNATDRDLTQATRDSNSEMKAATGRRTPKFPIIYCFDPGARGVVPVERFKDAAEKYGYIVVGSNNSRNGPQALSEIVRDLWADTHGRFSIDDQRIYVAGFSGGARVAISVGFWLEGKIAGVIASGAGFPADIPPDSPRSFSLFAVAGTDDFNNPEIQTLARKLNGSTPPVRLAIFDGGHGWLPAQAATDAVEWLEVQAMKSGIRERNPALINEIFQHAFSQASAAESGGDKYGAYRRYAAMVQDFSGLHDVAEVEKKAKELGATKAVKDAIKQEKRMEEDQVFRTQSIHKVISAYEASDQSFESLVALRGELKSYREAAKAPATSAKRTLARRVLGSVFVGFFEQGNMAMFRKEYERAATYFSICTEIQPDNAHAFFFLARAHALSGSGNKALDALKTAADKGFAGLQELMGKEFEELQAEKRFKEILEIVKKN